MNNLKTVENAPIASTNIVKLEGTQAEIIKKLLVPISNFYAIDFKLRHFPKEKKERNSAYYPRVHREIKTMIRADLGLLGTDDVKYELVKVDHRHCFFYIKEAGQFSASEAAQLDARIEKLCHEMKSNNIDLGKVIQSLFGLQFKMRMLEESTGEYDIAPAYFNSMLYLNAHFNSRNNWVKKDGEGYLDALTVDFFYSKDNELISTLHKRVFKVKLDDEMKLELDDTNVIFRTQNHTLAALRSLDARASKIKFFADKSKFKGSQAYTHNLVMNKTHDLLEELDIPFDKQTFQAKYEIDNFIVGKHDALESEIFVINAGVAFTKRQYEIFTSLLTERFPQFTAISVEEFNQLHRPQLHQLVEANGETRCPRAYIVLNPMIEGENTSITDTKLGPIPTFAKAYDLNKANKTEQLDFYTDLKIKLLNAAVKASEQGIEDKKVDIFQGFNIDEALLENMTYVHRVKTEHPDDYARDMTNNKSFLRKKANPIANKIKRVRTELWFKEGVHSKKQLDGFGIKTGHYTCCYVRRTDAGTLLFGYLEFEITDTINVIRSGVIEDDKTLDEIKDQFDFMERIEQVYNNGFYLYSHDEDVLLTTYHSIRVPCILGNVLLDSVKLLEAQEAHKTEVEARGGDPKEENVFLIRRSTRNDDCVLPYYLAPRRSNRDPLHLSAKLTNHHTYLQRHKEGVFVFLTPSQPPQASFSRQILIHNLTGFDADGAYVDPFNLAVTDMYLNSFTIDLLKNDESCKTSIFLKMVKVLVEN